MFMTYLALIFLSLLIAERCATRALTPAIVRGHGR
jgi:hypothetical protein